MNTFLQGALVSSHGTRLRLSLVGVNASLLAASVLWLNIDRP
jgi:hypothetical protein